ncbi:MAG TPA: hypothetical protein VKB88_13585 [Bryobacteraceae bacterium]|nr:hypothetical protein [Bryobacteraceae bacterium]
MYPNRSSSLNSSFQTGFDLRAHRDLIRAQLTRISESTGFVHSERMRQFLHFVVERSLAGETQHLKESVIGVEVFSRAPGYDPKLEPIVRIEARRLREKLQEYYERQASQDPVVIQLPKGGYVATFEMRPVPVAPSVQTMRGSPGAETPAVSVRLTSRKPWLIGAGVAALCVAGVFLAARRNPTMVPSLVPLTSLPGNAFRPSISPDGKRVAFVWDGGSDNLDIYIKVINTGEPFRLTTSPEADTDPAWSPDGSRIAFRRTFPDRDEIVVVAALGGAEHRIAVHTAGRSANTAGRARYGPAWSPDGREIAVIDSAGEEPFGVYAVTLESGEKRRLTRPVRRDEWDTDAAYSPRGDRLAFVRWRAGASGSSDLYVQSIKGGEPKRLTFDRRQISGLAWTPDGRHIVFSSDRNGDFRLWQIGSGGGAPIPVASAERGVLQPSLSGDGKRLAFSDQVHLTRIWRIPLAAASRTPEPFTFSSRRDDSPMYSPDGKRVVFISNRGGPSEIWVCDANGAHPSPVTSLGGFIPGTPRWSPDSADIVFDSRHEGFGAVYVISADGGRPRRLTPENSSAMMPSWSADGRFVYFTSDRTGSWQVWKQPLGGGIAIQITQKGGREAHESPDGKFVYYSGLGNKGLWRVSAGGGDENAIPEFMSVHHWRYWTVTSSGIYYLSGEKAPWTISLFDLATGHSQPVFTSSERPVLGTPGLSISPDGKFMLYSQMYREGSDIMMLENFE